MSTFGEFIQQVANMTWSDYLDIVIVAYLLYKLFPLFKSSGTIRVAGTVVAIIVIAWLTEELNLHTVSFISAMFCGLILMQSILKPHFPNMQAETAGLATPNLDWRTSYETTNYFGSALRCRSRCSLMFL